MRKTNKQGFTIVELVIVIAVIAILAAILIPTFVSLTRKANVASDTALVKNLNTALASKADGCKTMSEALAAAEEFGFDVAKINAKASKNEILWDSVNNVFCYFDSDKTKIAYIPEFEGKKDAADVDYWVIASTPSAKYSTYLYGYEGTDAVNVSTGIDVSAYEGLDVVFATDAAVTVTIVTNGGDITINAANANVNHYGYASVVTVEAVKGESYHVYGTVQFVEIKAGRVEIASGASVNAVFAANAGVKIDVVSGAKVTTVAAPEGVAPTVSGATPIVGDKDTIIASATLFAGGTGTEADPYLIADAEQLKNIGSKYDTYAYYKVMDGVDTIDCTGWPDAIKLNGSFDGNGVKLLNLTYSLFRVVGYNNTSANIVIKNIDVTMNTTRGTAFVRNIYNAGTTTFENVHIHGYIEGEYNLGSFYNYGTANYDDKGADYTVKFVNATSDATIVCTTDNTIGGLLGHGFEGADNTLTIEMDDKTSYTGKMYTNANTGYAIMGMCSHAEYILNGAKVSRYNNTYSTISLLTVKPEKTGNNYAVAVQSNVAKIEVSVAVQVTAYDSNGDQIVNNSGMTWVVSSQEYTEFADSLVVYTADFEGGAIVNNASEETKVAVENGVLTLHTGRSANYQSGTISLAVNQYDANGNIISVGTIVLVNIEK